MNDNPVPATDRTHVLQIVGNAIVGGMENYVARLIGKLPAERFQVTALCPFESPFTDRLRELGTEVFVTAITEDPSWQSIQLACALIQSSGVDVIQAHLSNAHVLAGLAGRLTGRPVLATIHGRAATMLDLEVQRVSDSHLGVVCRHSWFHALGCGVDERRLHFVPNGVDTERFRQEPSRTGPLRSRFAIDPATPLVGFVGRLSWEKGPDVFLRMALAVRAAHPDAAFLVVGEGPMLEQLQHFTTRFDLGAHVHFAGMQDDMPAVFNELDVAVSSSHSEAMPLAVMEAMACGLPVVACKVGGIADLVQHGVTGWLANDGDYEGLASRVSDLLADHRLRAAAGRAGRERAIGRFALDRSVEATAALLTQLATQRGDGRRFGTLHEATRPLRSPGAVKAAQR